MSAAPLRLAPPPPTVAEVPLDYIDVAAGTQMRVSINDDVVADYKEQMQAGDEFPPIVVFHNAVSDAYVLADGFHRFRAARAVGVNMIKAEVHIGSRSDAIMYAVAANRSHGLRRTNADKVMVVRAALAHEVMSAWSDRRIAEHVGVSNTMVSNMRAGLPAVTVSTVDTPAVRVGRDGKERPVQAPQERAIDADANADNEIAEAEIVEEGRPPGSGRPSPQLVRARVKLATKELSELRSLTKELAKLGRRLPIERALPHMTAAIDRVLAVLEEIQ